MSMPQQQTTFIWLLTIGAFVGTAFVVAYALDFFSQIRQAWNAAKKADEVAKSPGKSFNRRRSPRMTLYVPVLVYGNIANGEAFLEETTTTQVNDHGGLLMLATKVEPRQKLLLTNMLTQAEQECHVVRLEPKGGKTDVGVEFISRAPRFWQAVPVFERQHGLAHRTAGVDG